VNLLLETQEMLARHGKTSDDVEFVTDGVSSCPWELFLYPASITDYDEGYGSDEIYENLKIVGKDWWLERHEYDGREWWEYKTLPVRLEHGSVQIKTTPFGFR
jgi:hypothetical protein